MADDRMTPVAAAKELGIRPQLVYGFIKHGRIKTYPNPSGKTDVVSLKEVQSVASTVKPHRPKDPETGKPVKRQASVKRGSILSSHAYIRGNSRQKARPDVVEVVTGHVLDDEGNVSLVVTQTGEDTMPMYWETERLAARLAKGAVRLENISGMLGMVIFSMHEQGAVHEAEALRMWCEINGVAFDEIKATGTIQ